MAEEVKPIRVKKLSELSESQKAALTGFHTPAGRKAALEELGVEHDQEFCDEAKTYLSNAREALYMNEGTPQNTVTQYPQDEINEDTGALVERFDAAQKRFDQNVVDYLTEEVDPNGVEQHSPGAKLDAGKPDLSLLLYFGRALLDVGAVGTFGAQKYTRGGWQTVQDGENRYTAALLRHLMREGQGEKYDADSGLLHAAHAAWNALARLELQLRGLSENKKG
jgi:hypothetical protein